MKTIILLIVVFSLNLSANSQQVTLDLKNADFRQIARELEKQTGYSFLYNLENVQRISNQNIKFVNTDISEVLNKCLNGSGLSFKIVEGTIIIVPATPQANRDEVVIKGRVLDETGRGLPGATVKIKGTSLGTATDETGEFQIVSSGREYVLEVSFIGYQTIEVTGTQGKDIIVRMKLDDKEMDEVVVTGYQTIKKQRMTGTTTTITERDIVSRGFQSIDEILNSTVAGLNYVSTGRPGQDAQIQIRGVNSLTGSTEPIWIVDGMPMQGELPNITVNSTDLQTTIFTSGIGNIAPDDIKSITILKDAAATAIYGARAANGVIVVETKSGLSGKTRFNVSANFSIKERPVNNINMMNTADKIKFEREVATAETNYNHDRGRVTNLLNKLSYQLVTEEEVETEIARLSNINTDWFKEIFKIATSQQYNFSMSGGSEQTQHYVSLNFLTEIGTIPNNKYDRLGMSIKLTHNPSDKIRITGGLSATIKNDKVSASYIDPLQYAMYANTYERPYNEDGSYAADNSYITAKSSAREGLAWENFNILHELKRNTNSNRYLDAELNLKFEWEIIKGLMFTTHGVYNSNTNHNRIVEGEKTYTNFAQNWNTYSGQLTPDLVRGSLKEGTSYSNSYTFRNTLQYSFDIENQHYITLFAGQEISDRTTYSSFNYSPVFDEVHRIIGFPELSGVDGSSINFSKLGNTGKSVSKLSSFFANFSYSYLDRYILTGAVRYDGSDIIGNDNQFTPLWNFGARWNIYNEEFLRGVDFIDLLSLRAGFGFTGSIDKNALPFVVMTYGSSILYDGQVVPSNFSYPNPNVKWQTKRDLNIGFDVSLFQSRLEIGFNYYNNITKDVLDKKKLALSSGRNGSIENVADIYNNGYEIDLGVTLLKTDNFQWYAKGNIAVNNNKLKNTYYKSTDELSMGTLANANEFVEGYPVRSWFGYKFAGINPMNGAVLIYSGNEEATVDISTATSSWGDPEIFYLGKTTPPVVGGFSTSFNWKQWVFSTNIEYKTGHKIKSFNTNKKLDSRNRHKNDLNRWRQPGDITNVAALSESWSSYSMYMFDSMLEKGDYLRCTYVNLGYNLNSKLLKQIGLNTARFSFTARDLFTLSKYKGIDPSLMGSFDYPNSRKYTFTLNVGF